MKNFNSSVFLPWWQKISDIHDQQSYHVNRFVNKLSLFWHFSNKYLHIEINLYIRNERDFWKQLSKKTNWLKLRWRLHWHSSFKTYKSWNQKRHSSNVNDSQLVWFLIHLQRSLCNKLEFAITKEVFVLQVWWCRRLLTCYCFWGVLSQKLSFQRLSP